MRMINYLLITFVLLFVLSSKIKAYKEYKIGDIINYNKMDFYVIKNSDSEEDYVTLLKAEPLTFEELNLYGQSLGNINLKIYNKDNYGTITYYMSDKCNQNDYRNEIYTECSREYNNSDVKIVIDTWTKENFNMLDFKEARLITRDELINNLGCMNDRCTNSPYDWVYSSNYWYWTMTPMYSGWNHHMYVVDAASWVRYCNITCNNCATIRPVVELYKCAIDNSCNNNDTEEVIDNNNEIDVNNQQNEIIDDSSKKQDMLDNKAESKKSVNVPNTLKSVSGLIILIGLVLVCAGLNIFIIIKNRDRKKD